MVKSETLETKISEALAAGANSAKRGVACIIVSFIAMVTNARGGPRLI
jgi:hypothetical protein